MDAPPKRPHGPVIDFDPDSKRRRVDSGVPILEPSEKEKSFDDTAVARFGGPSDKLDLAKILQFIACNEESILETDKVSEQYRKIEHCRTAIRVINGLEDALRDAHKKSSYYSLCYIGECTPIIQYAKLTPCTRGTTSTAARDANCFARNCP